jgi:hypothetical protein
MDFLTATILSGITYDLIKCGTLLTADNFKERLREWVIGDSSLIVLADELNKLNLSSEMSELAIEKRITASPELMSLLQKIKPIEVATTINQSHSGSGDNVGRDKIIK